MIDFKNFITYIFIIGAAQGILLFFFLLKKKENKIANRFLAATMLLFAIDLVLEASAVTEHIKNYPALIGIMQAFPLLYGPALYLYVLFMIHGIKNFDLKYLFHFSPFILVQIYCVFFFYFESAEYQLNWVYLYKDFPWHLQLIAYLTPVYGGLYIVLTVYEAYRFNKLLKNNFSTIDKHNLSWVRFLSIGAVLLWIVAMFMTLLQATYDQEIRPELISYLSISIFIYAIAYKGLRQPEVVYAQKDLEKNSGFSKKSNSYKKSGLNEDEATTHIKNLLRIMDEEKPYKNEKLNLSDLAKMANVSSHNLSEIINTKVELNFYDFINSYRVEEVKKLILQDVELTYSILAHGLNAGFTSKSAFYSSFKKFTGITPAQYRKENL